jgi:alkylglycerol monooxygenase
MDTGYIVLAIPFFFLLIGIEYAIARAQKKVYFRFHDSIASLSCGIVQQMTGVLLKVLLIGSYVWAYEQLSITKLLASSGLVWIWAFVLVDLAYYWFHRASHRINFMWAAHVVHHQSEQYNLTTALRQSAFQGLMSAVFYLPLAILGFPPLVFFTAVTLNTLYQFWIHTRLIGKMGPLEWVLNTPSHHRVHHAIDPEYIDKNYAGMFIVWDRVFGTFTRESSPVHYGTVKGFRSWNPLWANFDEWVSILKLCFHGRNWRERAYAWIAPPEWRPKSMGGTVRIEPVPATRRLFDSQGYHGSELYVLSQFPVLALAVMALLKFQNELDSTVLYAGVGWVFASTLAWSGIAERKVWAPPLEFLRLALLPALVFWGTWMEAPSLALVTLAAALALVSLMFLRRNLEKDRPALSA